MPDDAFFTARPLDTGLVFPSSITLGDNDDLYISDTDNNQIQKYEVETRSIFKITGQSHIPGGFSGDGEEARQARINKPKGIAFDSNGFLYIADSQNFRIRKVGTRSSTIITTIAGTGQEPREDSIFPDSTLAERLDISPIDIVVDNNDNILFLR